MPSLIDPTASWSRCRASASRRPLERVVKGFRDRVHLSQVMVGSLKRDGSEPWCGFSVGRLRRVHRLHRLRLVYRVDRVRRVHRDL
jgi:hypothetical protein